MTRRALFFVASVPLALIVGALVRDHGREAYFWFCWTPVLAMAFVAWIWAFVEICER